VVDRRRRAGATIVRIHPYHILMSIIPNPRWFRLDVGGDFARSTKFDEVRFEEEISRLTTWS